MVQGSRAPSRRHSVWTQSRRLGDWLRLRRIGQGKTSWLARSRVRIPARVYMMLYSLIHCIAGCWKLWNVLHDVLLLYTLYCRLLETLECITWCFTPLYIVLPVVGNFGMYYMMFYSFIHCIASSWKLWNVLHDVLLLYTLFCRLLETLECVTHALD
jgi:hypothetical protein